MFAFILILPNAWGYSQDECIRCHRPDSTESRLHIDLNAYRTSVHANEIGCVDCHVEIADDAHFNNKNPETVDCRKCHEKKDLHAADQHIPCSDCHTRHRVYSPGDPRASVHWTNLKHTCKGCHPAQTGSARGWSRMTAFHIVFHAKQDLSTPFDEGMCVGCHQGRAAHGEQGTIDNLDCQRCHLPDQGQKWLSGNFHPDRDWRAHPMNVIATLVSFIGLLGFILLFVKVFMGFFVNGKK